MDKTTAARITREELDKNNLQDWHIRFNNQVEGRNTFLGLCSYKDKCIILNAYHVEMHPEPEVLNTIQHEIAHALCPNEGHNSVWAERARALGCIHVEPCSHLSFSPEVIDAIRSGADVTVEIETEVIHRPKYTITRLQDKCEFCGKVAITERETLIIGDEYDEKFITLQCGHLLVKRISKGTPFHKLLSSDNKKPYPFQADGMRFIEAALAVNKGAAIFDEMGLGKTIQALGYLKFHSESAPILFILKSGIKFQWFKEILRWIGDDYCAQIIEKSNDFIIPGLKAYIISYDLPVHKTRKIKGKIVEQGFDINKFYKDDKCLIRTIVLDECQQIKNPDSGRTKWVRKLAKDCNVIALSGTPWKNRGSEFFTILNMLAPMKFPSYERFIKQWVDFYYQGSYLKQGGIKRITEFKDYIKDIAIRREVADVMKELPDVNRTLHYCELDNLSQNTYDEEVSDFVKWYNDKIIGGNEDDFETSSNMLAKLARMRHITGLAKIPATVEFCETFLEETDRKLTIFVHHKDVGEILTDEIRKISGDVPVFKLTAELSSEERFILQEKFNDTPRAILVASTLASGEGINLQTCSDSILHERQWNPQNEDQAAPGRFRRIGSLASIINVIFMTAAGTVDEHLAAIVEGKRAAFHNTMNNGEMPVFNQTSMVKELAQAIVSDHNKKNSITKKAAMSNNRR